MEKSTKYYSNIQEKQISDALGWHQVSGSGARNMHPGDVISDDWMGECKTHTKPGNKIVFDFKVWEKIRDEAISQFKYAVLFSDDGSQRLDRTWCMFNILPPTDEYLQVVHPINKSASLRFDHSTMKNMLRSMGAVGGNIMLLKLHCPDMNIDPTYVSTFEDFKLLFGDM